MRPTAFDEASRQTYGRLYWVFTAVLVLATVAVWIWGDDRARSAVGVVAIGYILVFAIVNHVRMNRIVRERRAGEQADPGGPGGPDEHGDRGDR